MAAALEENKTLEELSVGNVIVGSSVKLKSSGELCTVTYVRSDGSLDVRKADGSTLDYVGREGKDQFEPIPAVLPLKKLRDSTITELDFKNSGLGVDGGMMLAAVLKSNSSVTKVSDCEWLVRQAVTMLQQQPSTMCMPLACRHAPPIVCLLLCLMRK